MNSREDLLRTESEYWKSVPRKFCDFCKCWITDNKPSVDFHERGKRHQENVERRLKEVRKKSYEQSLEQDTIDKQMEKMEKAALEAFKKDLAANPELAKQYGVSLEPKPKPKTDSNKDSNDKSEKTDAETKKKGEEESQPNKEWYEAKSPEGYSYYWNTVTGESIWEAPEQFVSLEEQEAENKQSEDKTQETDEPAASAETEEQPSVKRRIVDPGFSRSAFGAWSVVKEESQPVIYNESSEAPVPDDIPLPADIPPPKASSGSKFKERTVSSLGPSTDSGPTTFKKRKIASGARNVRQRGDDD